MRQYKAYLTFRDRNDNKPYTALVTVDPNIGATVVNLSAIGEESVGEILLCTSFATVTFDVLNGLQDGGSFCFDLRAYSMSNFSIGKISNEKCPFHKASMQEILSIEQEVSKDVSNSR